MPRRLERVMWVGDNHGDHEDAGAVAAAMEFADYFKPVHRIHVGDGFDLRPFRRSASDEERRDAIKPDVERGIAFLGKFKPTVYLFGNHDARLNRARESDNKPLAEYATALLDEIHKALRKARVYPYDKRRGVHYLGNTASVHGYASGLYAVRKHALAYGNVMMGHIHAVDVAAVERLPKSVGRSIGCLCALDQDYNAGQLGTLRQEHGFAYGFFDPATGETHIHQAQPIGGRWHFPTEFREG